MSMIQKMMLSSGRLQKRMKARRREIKNTKRMGTRREVPGKVKGGVIVIIEVKVSIRVHLKSKSSIAPSSYITLSHRSLHSCNWA
jgi:hypothetical protein